MPVGSTVTWTYFVTNTGNVPLANVTVTDDNGTPGNTADDFHPTFTGGDTNSNGLLDLTETWTYQATGTATAGQYENFATVSGQGGGQTVTDDNPDHYFGQTAGKNLEFEGSMEGALKWTAGRVRQRRLSLLAVAEEPGAGDGAGDGHDRRAGALWRPAGPAGRESISVPVSIAPFTIPANSTAKYLTPDQNNILSWMGAVQSPDLCAVGVDVQQ